MKKRVFWFIFVSTILVLILAVASVSTVMNNVVTGDLADGVKSQAFYLSGSLNEMKANGVEFVGTRKELITMDKDWEKPHVEGPWLIDHGNWYYLFYSANEFSTKNYCVGVARAKSPLGPYKKADQPILRSAGKWAGPGHGSVVTTPKGETWHIYHSWYAGNVGSDPGRIVLLDRVFWRDGWPTMFAAPSAVSLPPP